MIIRNNTVFGNGGIGIICSLDCYNVLIENNNVYDNAAS
jgi:mannuronan 5-epimerase